MDLSNVDFGGHAPTPSSDKLKQLTDLVNELEYAERAVALVQAELKKKQDYLRLLSEDQIPALMLELNQPVLHTSDGRKITLKDVVRARLPEAHRPLGHKWLIENGHGGMVKRTVEVAFAAGQEESASTLLRSMEEDYGGNARQVMKVEPSSLTAFVKKQLAEGKSVPRDVFEVREFKHIKISK